MSSLFWKFFNLSMLVLLFSTPFWIRFTWRSYHEEIVVVRCTNHVSNHVFKVFITRRNLNMRKQDILTSMLRPQPDDDESNFNSWIEIHPHGGDRRGVGFKPSPQLNTSYLLPFSVDFFLICSLQNNLWVFIKLVFKVSFVTEVEFLFDRFCSRVNSGVVGDNQLYGYYASSL